MKKVTIRYMLIASVVTIAIWGIYWKVIAVIFPTVSDRGPFGDSFGALNTLFTGLAFVAVLATLIQQSHQIEETQRDILESRRMDREKMRLELYDRRFRLYKAILDFIGFVSSSERVAVQRVIAFDEAAGEARFLFSGDSGILDYLKLVRDKADECNTLVSLLQQVGDPPNEQRKEYAARLMKVKEWLFEQPDVVRSKFSPYLAFGGDTPSKARTGG